MVYTNQLLVFTRLGNDDLVDIIPLKEIVAVRGIEEEREVDPFSSFTEKTSNEDSGDAQCSLEVNTSSEGYNSGRVFMIRVDSKKAQQVIIDDLTRFSAHEREKIAMKSKYKKTQDKIAVIIDSTMVQKFSAFLITMVRFCETMSFLVLIT